MNNELTKQLFRFFLLLALQVLIFNHICLFGFMSPDIYLLALMLLPLTLSKSVQYIIAFATGLIVDLFALTYGIHALASLLMITLRPWIIILLSINKKKMDENVPSPKNRDFRWLLPYTLLMVFSHQLIIDLIEAWSFSRFGATLLSLAANTLFTSILILCLEYIFIPKKTSTPT